MPTDFNLTVRDEHVLYDLIQLLANAEHMSDEMRLMYSETLNTVKLIIGDKKRRINMYQKEIDKAQERIDRLTDELALWSEYE